MWALLALAVCIGAAILYIPGFLALRGFGLSRFASAICAPLLFLFLSNALYVVYGKLGIACSLINTVLPLMVVGLAVYVAGRVMRKPSSEEIDFGAASSALMHPSLPRLSVNVAGALLYLVCGIVATSAVFLASLPTPDAFIESFDNVHHLGSIRAFYESSDYSSLGASMYRGDDAALDPLADGGFYPSAWHAFAAMLMSAVGLTPAAAASATNVLFTAVVFPLSTFAALRVLFGEHARASLLGAPLVLVNAELPWHMYTWGPLYPNVMAYCMVPILLFLFVGSFNHGMSRRTRIWGLALFLVGMGCMVFVQPNGVFAAGVLVAPYIVYRVAQTAGKRGRRAQWTAGVLATLAIAVVWTAVFLSPFMQGVIGFYWWANDPLPEAIVDALTLRFKFYGHQVACSFLLVAGVVRAVLDRKYLWMVFSFLFAALIYVGAVTNDGAVQHFLAGFWYNDAPRVAAVAALAALPLEVLGLATFVKLALQMGDNRGNAKAARIGATAFALVVYVLAWLPLHQGEDRFSENPVWQQAAQIELEYGRIGIKGNQVFTFEEQQFVEEVMAILPEDAVVVNEPGDGSAYAYGVYGLPTYYRYWRTYGVEEETWESVAIRTRLSRITQDEDVRKAVESIGAVYVLQLDKDHGDHENRFWTYDQGTLWGGIDSIYMKTPGFEVLLADGDMRLYKIVL